MSDDLVKRLRTGLSMLAQEEAADRIEELEAKNEHAWNMVAKGDSDVIKAVSRNRELEAKLAKAVEALHWIGTRSIILDAGADSLRLHARMILAELKGEK